MSTTKTTKSKELTMEELQEMWLECEVVACSNVCGPHENNIAMKKLGVRAYNTYNETIGEEIELLDARATEINENPLKPDASEKQTEERSKAVKELSTLIKKMWRKKASIEYEEVLVKISCEEGKEFSDKFATTKRLTIKGKLYELDPYSAFINLETKGFIVTTK